MADSPSTYTQEQLLDCKKKFAKIMLESTPDRALDVVAALLQSITPSPFTPNPYYTIAYANTWPFDPDVIEETEKLLSVAISKGKFVREVLGHARNSKHDIKDRLGYYRLAYEVEWGKDIGAAATKNGKQTDDKLAELAAMIVKPPTKKEAAS